jgi:hypothetical protein
MTLCWKCKNPLRADAAAFCPTCGAAQKRDADADPGATRDWQARLSPVERPPSWGLAFLWLIAWPIAPLTYPVFLVKATRRLRRHVVQRLRAPALASPRFTEGAQGRQIEQRLADSAGKLTSGGALPAFLSFVLIAAMAIVVFATAANAPAPIRFGAALDAEASLRPARAYVPIYSRTDYDSFWTQPSMNGTYTRVKLQSGYDYEITAAAINSLGTWSDGENDTAARHRPYEYLETRRGEDARQSAHRVLGASLEWNGTENAGVAFLVLLGLLYLLYTGWGLLFWARFARHTRAEAVAAAYATGDVAFHDRLVPGVDRRNTVLLIGMFVLSILPMFFWHIVLFPVSSAIAFARHPRWEKRSGVAAALGIAG